MNAKNAKGYLPFVQALAEGKVIQIKTGFGWQDLENVSFGDIPSEYRIKPEPREIWVNRNESGMLGDDWHPDKDSAAHGLRPGWTPVRFREVIE